jgi:hydrogenase expression/formation protein HypC
MCIGIPMQVMAVEPGFAQVSGRGEMRRVNTLLIGNCKPGQCLLVFLNDAREVISDARALEINATLDMLQAVLDTGALPAADDPGFVLPSAMNMADLKQLTQS